jgi:acetyl-CoA C-acetyltransferase
VREAVICEPLRTPVGGFGGSLRDVPVQELAATVIRAVMERTGLPVTASGLQIDRRCGSGLQAVVYAAMQVQTGPSEVVLAGGAESMSNAPFYSTAMR